MKNNQQQKKNNYNNNNNYKQNHNNNNNRQSSQSTNRNRILESSNPYGKIKGTSQQLFEKYSALARDSLYDGNNMMSELFYQYAEHYYRIHNFYEDRNNNNNNNNKRYNNQNNQNNTDSEYSSKLPNEIEETAPNVSMSEENPSQETDKNCSIPKNKKYGLVPKLIKPSPEIENYKEPDEQKEAKIKIKLKLKPNSKIEEENYNKESLPIKKRGRPKKETDF